MMMVMMMMMMEKTPIRHQKNEFGGGEVTSFIRTQNRQDTANTATFSKATNARRLRVAFGPHRGLFLARETQIWYQNKNGVGWGRGGSDRLTSDLAGMVVVAVSSFEDFWENVWSFLPLLRGFLCVCVCVCVCCFFFKWRLARAHSFHSLGQD